MMADTQGRPFPTPDGAGGFASAAIRKAGMARPARDERIANLENRGPG